MNRRKVLQGLAALSFMTTFDGCHPDDDKDDKSKHDGGKTGGSSAIRTLRIILQGPFAVVMQKDRNYRVKAYVPYDNMHEFRFPSPLIVQDKNKYKFFQFKLEEESLELSGRAPYVDHGFDGFNPEICEWRPPSDTFVSLDLPAPNVISYFPPTIPVLFESGQFTTLPRNHVLEYRVKEGCKVHLQSKQVGDCTPLTCDDLYQQLMRERKDDQAPETTGPQYPSMAQELTRCSESDVCTFFLGVGLRPRPREQNLQTDRDHALTFFNEKLLPSLYGKNIPKGQKIAKLDASPCSQSSGATMSPVLMPAVQRLPFPEARLVPAASTENCTAPTATATARKTVGP
jgi:hypothetical protein